ncbi:MAG TPA: Mut7-C RNAse domain-containing protein [Spirochaetota bacterium]|nr:Mut7-C RNAse domain-containing protein [Spirochaetota bacterium]HPJ33906.1 Mut7-C RNAse domain-containing protein [Spirochaetota bacterium]
MYNITIRYYEELNDFLKPELRKRDIELSFKGRRSVKDLIESMGVPHVEVDLILVNGSSVGFSYIIEDLDRISVYPVFESIDIADVTRLRPSPLRDTKFVLDVHLRKLARSMRLLGFDTDYEEGRDDDLLAAISERENRILLTCDRQLLMRKIVSRGIIVRSRDPEEQIIEVIERLQLEGLTKPFTRCIECNGFIEGLDLSSPRFRELEKKIPPGVLEWCREFYHCLSCGRIYWKGSHYDRLIEKTRRIIDSLK